MICGSWASTSSSTRQRRSCCQSETTKSASCWLLAPSQVAIESVGGRLLKRILINLVHGFGQVLRGKKRPLKMGKIGLETLIHPETRPRWPAQLPACGFLFLHHIANTFLDKLVVVREPGSRQGGRGTLGGPQDGKL